MLTCFALVPSAFADAEGPTGVEACRSCHELLYYNHDIGKWYCQCKTPVSCTGCHDGRSDTFVEEEAHLGMIANPLVDDAAVCKDCHLEDTPQYVERFAAIAGVHPIHPCPPS
ncbi:MAG: hypothetical protein PHS96_04250 [Anaerolineales bacterium]|nr:hypothetical protein [Anaerolineales bacterium]